MPHLDEGTLHTYLDGELEDAEVAELREHLATCAECRARLDVARATRTRAHEILRYADPPAIETPDFATLRARKGARATPVTPARTRVRPLVLPWAASLVLALGVGWFAQSLLSGGSRPQRVAVESDAGRSAETAEPMAATAPPAEFGSAPEPAPRAAAPGASDMADVADAPSPDQTPQVETPRPPPATETRVGVMRARDAGAAEAAVPDAGAAPAPPRPEAESMLAIAQGEPTPEVATPSESVAIAAVTARGAAAGENRADARSMGYARADTPVAEAAEQAAARAVVAAAMAAPPAQNAPEDAIWILADSVAIKRALGAPPALIPGLPLVSQAVAPELPGMVRVIQRLPGGETVEIYQGGSEVVIRATVSRDSLERLKQRLEAPR